MTEQCKRKVEGIVELLEWITRGRNEFNLYNICCHLTSLHAKMVLNWNSQSKSTLICRLHDDGHHCSIGVFAKSAGE